jgi:hypothetical protein
LNLNTEKLENLWMAEHYAWDPEAQDFIVTEPGDSAQE